MPLIQKVIIIGASPVGLAAALLLQQRNHLSSTIYEARPISTASTGALTIRPNGLRLLNRLGVYSSLLKRASVSYKIVFHNSRGGELGERSTLVESDAKTRYGRMCVRMADFVDVLLDKMVQDGEAIEVRWGKKVVGVKEDKDIATVVFEDGTSDTADLVLGCDGIYSVLRALYVAPEAVPQYSGLSSIFGFCSTQDMPEISIPVACNHVMSTQDGLFALMPCTEARNILLWLFVHEVPIPATGNSRDGWKEHGRTEVEGFKAKILASLKDATGEWGFLFNNVVRKTKLAAFSPILHLPLGTKWFRGRCILLGDAGHAIEAHTGQGISMALEDVFLLSRFLETPYAKLSDIFEKFDELRRPRVEGHNLAAQHGNSMKTSGAWALRFREFVLMGALWVIENFKLDSRTLGDEDLAYDIDEVMI